MDLRGIKAQGPDLTPSQQGAFYYARKRRRAREQANASDFIARSPLGLVMGTRLDAALQSVSSAFGVTTTVTLTAA